MVRMEELRKRSYPVPQKRKSKSRGPFGGIYWAASLDNQEFLGHQVGREGLHQGRRLQKLQYLQEDRSSGSVLIELIHYVVNVSIMKYAKNINRMMIMTARRPKYIKTQFLWRIILFPWLALFPFLLFYLTSQSTSLRSRITRINLLTIYIPIQSLFLFLMELWQNSTFLKMPMRNQWFFSWTNVYPFSIKSSLNLSIKFALSCRILRECWVSFLFLILLNYISYWYRSIC